MMVDDKIQPKLRNVAVGLLTPFEEDLDGILYNQLASTAKWLYNEEIRLFLACANISEYHSLSHEERIECVSTARKAIPPDGTVLGGVGGSTKVAIDLAQKYESNEADGIMVMPLDHTFKHESGMVSYYKQIANSVDIDLVPYLRGFEITPQLVKNIATLDGVVGIKWAISDIELFSKCVNVVDEDIVWMCGMGEPPAPAYYYEGADGFSAGVTNFLPKLGLSLFEALESGRHKQALRLRNLTHQYMDLRSGSGQRNIYSAANSIPAVKAGLEFSGQYGGPVREPLVELSKSDYDRAQRYYNQIQTELSEIIE